mgnify:CR=1 FL=1
MPAIQNDLTQGSVTRKLIRYALPLVASSRPRITRPRVDFPQPEGPITLTNSPSATEKERSRIASISPSAD